MSLTTPRPQPMPPSPNGTRSTSARGSRRSHLPVDGSDQPWYKREFYLGRAVKPVLVMNFARQLASFLRSGIPILEALDIVGEESADDKMGQVIESIREVLIAGGSFGDAVAVHPKVFPGYFIAMIRAAELTGQLDEVLEQVAVYMERDITARRQVKSALTYPTFVLGLALLAVVVMSVWVLPKFKSLYDGLGARLPFLTRTLLAGTGFFASYWPFIFAGLALVALAVYFVIGGERGKSRRDHMVLDLPVLGPLSRLVCVERFCRVLSALATVGVPLPEAVDVAADSTNNRVFQDRLADVRNAMVRGEGLARPIAASGLFPTAARQMIRVGESTGTLDQQLRTAASFYERELSYRLKKATDLFEPIIIVVVGVVVGVIAVAQVSAMYSIFRQIKA